MTINKVVFLQNRASGAILDLASVRTCKSLYYDLKVLADIYNKSVKGLDIALSESLVYTTKRKRNKAITAFNQRLRLTSELINSLGYDLL